MTEETDEVLKDSEREEVERLNVRLTEKDRGCANYQIMSQEKRENG